MFLIIVIGLIGFGLYELVTTVFKNGVPVDTLVGFMPKNQLKD